MNDNLEEKISFWGMLPGLLTGCAALITAIGRLLTVLFVAGLSDGLLPPTPTPTPIAEAPLAMGAATATLPPVFVPTDTPTAKIPSATPTPTFKPRPDL